MAAPWTSDEINQATLLAKERSAAIAALIRGNPQRALEVASALSWEVRNQLPPAVEAELETWISGKGEYVTLCPFPIPGRPGPLPSWRQTFRLGDTTFEAHVYGRRLGQISTRNARFHGVAVGNLLAVHEDAGRILSSAEAAARLREPDAPRFAACALTGVPLDPANPPALVEHGEQLFAVASVGLARELRFRLADAETGFLRAGDAPEFQTWSHGVKSLLFMRARFPDDPREPITAGEAAEVMQAANDYFVASSYNQLSLVSTIGPLITLPQPKLYYSVAGPGALLEDARAATRAAGVEPNAFDLDMVRFETVPGFDWGGLGAVGGRGVWLQGSSLGVICHELGHNLGLSHANFWNTLRPDLPEETRNLPFDPDSLVGIDSVIGPGDDVEYGDPFDMMGGGGSPSSHFSALHKRLLEWIPSGGALPVTTSGVYRLAAHDAGRLSTQLPQVLSVRKDAERFYWIEARSNADGNVWTANGLEIRWNNWRQAIGTAQLLDTTPGSRHGRSDAALPLGKTFADAASQVFITPLRRGQTDIGGATAPWFDVLVALGPFPSNRPPTLEVSASALQVAVGQPVTFTASTSDPDGDPIVFSWDLGEGEPGPSASTIVHAWPAPGDYVVRCEATDGFGGVASRHLVVRVGNVNTLRITGRVIDQAGRPLQGVRVHNGQSGTNSPYADDYRWAITDSDGRYTLANLGPGEYPMGAVLDGYIARPLNFTRPLVLNAFTGVDVDFIATALPEVSVESLGDVSEVPGGDLQFRVRRTGRADLPLRVYFHVSGSATEIEDYTPWPNTEVQTNTIGTLLGESVQLLTYQFIDFQPGVTETNIVLPVRPDSFTEGDESVVVTLAYPVTRTIISETETNTVDIPGWEVALDNGRETWFQTRPEYHLGPRHEAEARILDGAPPGPTTFSIVALDAELSENAEDSASFLVAAVGRPPVEPIVIPLSFSGTATVGEDYAPSSRAISFAAGQTVARGSIAALDDQFLEGNEEIIVRLEPGAGYELGASSASIRLVDDDLPRVSIAALDPVVSEAGGPARIAVQRSGDLSQTLDVDYLLSGTATAGLDYAPLPGRVVIPAGASSATFALTPLNDSIEEGDETIVIQIGDSPVYNLASPAVAHITLRDDEFPTLTVEAIDDEAAEGDDTGTFVIRRTGAANRPIVVRYRLGGSARHQADYIASGDQLTLGVGQTQATLVITPLDDNIREDEETITLELLPDPSYALGAPAWAAIRLLDNGDNDPAVGFALLESSGPESVTQPRIAVRISGNPDEGEDRAVTVAWDVLGGTAIQDVDYVLASGSLTFTHVDPGDEDPLSNRVALIPLEIIDDELAETNESLLIRLRVAPTEIPSEDPETPPTLVTNGVLDVLQVHTYTILDDDLARLSVTATAPATAEGGATPARFTVTRTGPTNAPLTVLLHLSGLATPGADYVDLPRTLVIPAGASSAEVAIVPIDDPIAEYQEDVVLTLMHAAGAKIDEPRQAIVTIDDNDGAIEFAAARMQAVESDPFARVRIRRFGDTNVAASALFTASPGTATPNEDYEPVETLVSFQSGEIETEVRIPIIQDELVEGPETILLRLARASDLFPMGGQNTAVLTLLDDDAYLTTGTNTPAAAEGDPAMVITVERTGAADAAETLRYATADREALDSADYRGVSGEIHFAPGQVAASFLVPLLDDQLLEGDETFAIEFFRETDEPVAEIIATIVDDDCVIELGSSAVAALDEDSAVAELELLRRGSALRPVSVAYESVSGTALSGQDFAPAAGVIEFRGNRREALTNGMGETVFIPGDTHAVISIRVFNDAEGERDETFEVRLTQLLAPTSAPPALPFARWGAITNTVITIRDNEAPGWVDDQFQPGLGADASVRAIAVQRDGKILLGGDFSTLHGVVLPRVGRLHADGLLDRSFNPGLGADASVRAVAELSDGRILIGGEFSNVDGDPRPRLAILEADGTPAAWNGPAPDGAVHAIRAGDEILVAGDFNRIGSHSSPGVARLAMDGSPNASFSTGAHGRPGVRAVQRLADGRILAGGTFTSWGGSRADRLVRLLPDGQPDSAFGSAQGANGAVHSIVRAPDDSLYIAGEFTMVGGVPRNRLARLLPDGSVDIAFDPGEGLNATGLAVAALQENAMVAAGAFTSFDGAPAGRFAVLGANGAPEESYARGLGANNLVRALAVQADGAFLIGGDFTEVDGRPRFRIARIHSNDAFAEGFIEFAESVFVAEEGGEAQIVVRRTGTGKSEARVRYLTQDATAQAGADYVAASGELVFPPGVVERAFSIQILEDDAPEGHETARLILTNATGGLLGRRASVDLLIQDNEDALAFERSAVEVDETAGAVTLVVRRSGATNSQAQVDFATVAGTAQAGVDFEPAAGALVFAPGVDSRNIVIPIHDDDLIEGPETFLVQLSAPAGGPALGSQAVVQVTIADDDRAPTHFTLTVETSPGGTAVPSGGRFPAGSTQTVWATPEPGFEFARWEGTLVSVHNPLSVLMDRDHALVARFLPRDYLETFESGDFSRLPWEFDGDAPWVVTDETASGGEHSARSGAIPARGRSVLRLRRETGVGGGSFDFRAASERGWDFLEFHLNGQLVKRWSGDLGWQTFQFNVPAGDNTFEWIFSRDATFGGGFDAAWIDNLDLPEPGGTPVAPRVRPLTQQGGCLVEGVGAPGRRHVLQMSTDLRVWTDVAEAVPAGEPFTLMDPGYSGGAARFYRVRVD